MHVLHSKATYLLKEDMTRLFGHVWMLASCQDGLIGLASGTALGAASMVVRPKVQWSSGVPGFHLNTSGGTLVQIIKFGIIPRPFKKHI